MLKIIGTECALDHNITGCVNEDYLPTAEFVIFLVLLTIRFYSTC